MALLRVINFGGLMPSADERALPPNAGTVVTNLHPGSSEFRPTLAELTYAGVFSVVNPRSIYRMGRTSAGALNTDPAAGWLSYTIQTAHAKWANAADTTERTTVTPLDGSYAPRVIDATGTDRLLGVPVPAKPTVTLNEGDYYTEAERDHDEKHLRAAIIKTLRLHIDRAKVGAVYTDNEEEGYLEIGTEVFSVLPVDGPSPQRYRVYRFDAEDGTMTDAYTAALETDVAWVVGTKKGVFAENSVSDPLWMGGLGIWHYKIKYHAYGIGYKLDSEATLTTDLDAIEFIDTDQAENIAELVAELLDPGNKPAQAVIKPLQEAVEKLEYAIDHRAPGMKTSDEISDEQTALILSTAKEIWNLLYTNGSQAEIPGVTTGP